jgi:aspartyl-tRNA(Asn)/glutamyl-tRNA(Gln) amidotransferase subunit A
MRAGTPLHDVSIVEASARIRERELSPLELTRACLERISALEPDIKAFVTVLADEALAAAQAAEDEIQRGGYRGPLHGIPIALKDLYNTAGIRTTSSSRQRDEYVPTYDAAATERLAAAGTILLGKTVTHEFAYGVVSQPTCNPWDLDRIPGGSSGGSAAAVAAGECLGAMGSDTGGSIRIPAAFTGITGIKPTFGRVSKYGVAPLGYSLDHAGPMARSVEDAAIMLQAVSGYDPRDRTSIERPVPDFTASLHDGVSGLRLGVPSNYYFDNVDPEVRAAVDAAIRLLAGQGAELVPVELPHIEYALPAEFAIVFGEASSFHQRYLREHPERYTPEVRILLEAGELLPAPVYVKAQRARALIQQGFREAFEAQRLVALLAPTLPATAARHGQQVYDYGDPEPITISCVRLSCPANLTGLPALSVPCGFSSEGLPVGLQIIGRPFDEPTVLRVGQAYQGVTEWHLRRPPC